MELVRINVLFIQVDATRLHSVFLVPICTKTVLPAPSVDQTGVLLMQGGQQQGYEGPGLGSFTQRATRWFKNLPYYPFQVIMGPRFSILSETL